jgi:hypothetical protein
MKLLRHIFDVVRGLARELSDENGYERYLRASGRARSRDAWKAFSDLRHRKKYQNAKCC